MKRETTSLLGYALLGLIHQKPCSGYDLRKMFAETAMGSYSSSPGAIYPALERLEKRGLIKSEVEEGAGLRRRRVYRLTADGTGDLKRWLSRAVTRGEVGRGIDELMLRFAFMERSLGSKGAIQFLRNLKSEVKAYLPSLKAFLRQNGPKMPLSAMLALDSGIRNYEALQRWTDYAIKTYEAAVARGKAKSERSSK